jgi:putative transposase
VYRYIQAEKAKDPEAQVAVMCRVLGVSRSGYYDWCRRGQRPTSGRLAENLALIDQIRRVHEQFRYYGSPRIRAELLAAHPRLGRHRVARLMQANGIRANRGKVKGRKRAAPPSRRPEIIDLVQRDFHADAQNAVWFTDITQIRTGQGWLYAALILDAFNREVITWAVAGHDTPNTALNALRDAIKTRRPPPGCIIHSDRGYQFTAHDWITTARTHRLTVSIGARKSCFDNAAMESWFASFKNEEIYPNGQPATRDEARQRLFRYIWTYNTVRRHSTLGYVAPITYATESSICP